MHTGSWSLAPSWLTTVCSTTGSSRARRAPSRRAFRAYSQVGDVRSRSMKRVASSVGEGSGSIKEINHYLESQSKWAALRRSPA